VRSLHLQGGVMRADEAACFRARPYAESAMQLRRFDDLAKVAGRPTPDLQHFSRWRAWPRARCADAATRRRRARASRNCHLGRADCRAKQG
jgi:hypothetical protein